MKKTLLIFYLLYSLNLQAEKVTDSTMMFYEDSLKILLKTITFSNNDFEKYEANKHFLLIMEDALDYDRKLQYPFDSLKYLSKLVSPDKAFRIISWQIPKSDGSFEYFGYLQSYNPKQKKYIINQLIDKSFEIVSAETQNLDASHWFGALYYKVIVKKTINKTLYTLLGWNGNNNISRKKIIEILYFRKNGDPVFGYPCFRNYNKGYKRVIFEYSADVYMSLKYEKQNFMFSLNKKKKKEINDELIVFDRLAPMEESLIGNYQYYVPETNVIDGFVFYDGKWVFVKDIDAKNIKTKNNITPQDKRPQEMNLYNPNK